MDRKTSVSGNDNSRDGSNCFLLAQPDGGVLPRLRWVAVKGSAGGWCYSATHPLMCDTSELLLDSLEGSAPLAPHTVFTQFNTHQLNAVNAWVFIRSTCVNVCYLLFDLYLTPGTRTGCPHLYACDMWYLISYLISYIISYDILMAYSTISVLFHSILISNREPPPLGIFLWSFDFETSHW